MKDEWRMKWRHSFYIEHSFEVEVCFIGLYRKFIKVRARFAKRQRFESGDHCERRRWITSSSPPRDCGTVKSSGIAIEWAFVLLLSARGKERSSRSRRRWSRRVKVDA